MARKEPIDKLKTKIATILNKDGNEKVVEANNQLTVDGELLLSFNENEVVYTAKRFYPTKVVYFADEDHTVRIPLNHDNLKFVSRTSTNPPRFAGNVLEIFRDLSGQTLTTIVLGSDENGIEGSTLKVTLNLYNDIAQINSEEGQEKRVRVNNRVIPFIANQFDFEAAEQEAQIDYGLLLREVIASGEITQKDIQELTNQLETGNINNFVIQRQVNKQVEWLIESIEQILDEGNITVPKAKDLGHDLFGYTKVSVNGPEHLMEKILTDYGQYSLFGVPALLNTDKYVTHSGDLSRSQFDILLVNHVGDIELVELKRPDKYLLEYNSGRGKFYASADLAMAISQCERYISTIIKDNDDDFKIKGQKIREYLNSELGGVMHVESVRPSALIIMGSSTTIYKHYDDLSASQKLKVTKEKYEANGDRAYIELKSSFKNIKILTYSELMENARTRLEILRDED